jgi:hypothetical protein
MTGVTRAQSLSILQVLVLNIVVLLLLLKHIVFIFVKIPLGYNEGWNLYLAMAAYSSENLYPNIRDFTANNYPPVSFFLLGAIGASIGDELIAGRAIAFLAFVAVAAAIGLIVVTLTSSRGAGAIAALLFAAIHTVWFSDYLAMNDPQWLAHAVMTSALYVFIAGERTVRRITICAGLALAAGLIKHNLVPLPLAVSAWLLFYDRRNFFVWLTASAALLGVVGIVVFSVFGSNFYHQLVTPREYAFEDALRSVELWAPRLACWLVAAALAVVLGHRRPMIRLVTLYAVLSALIGFVALGGAGADYNYLFDLTIALAILIGVLFAAVVRAAPPTAPRWTVEGLLILLLISPLAGHIPAKLAADIAAVRAAPVAELVVRRAVDKIAHEDGPAMCETLTLCYWAGKDFAVDFFNTGQKMAAGLIEEKTLVEMIEEHRFSVAQIEQVRNGHPVSGRLPTAVNVALARHYEVESNSPNLVGALLVPRSKSMRDVTIGNESGSLSDESRVRRPIHMNDLNGSMP